jgi:hypothetical protein
VPPLSFDLRNGAGYEMQIEFGAVAGYLFDGE